MVEGTDAAVWKGVNKMAVKEITQDTFETEVMQSEVPVLVDFSASWCGPCKMVAPVLEEISEELESVKICKVDIDAQPDLASRYQVMSVPTMILMKKGEILQTIIGFHSKAEILAILQ